MQHYLHILKKKYRVTEQKQYSVHIYYNMKACLMKEAWV